MEPDAAKSAYPERKEQIVISVVGIRYDDQGASVKDVYTDQLKMQLATLNDLGRKWTVRINREVQRCEDTAKTLEHSAWS